MTEYPITMCAESIRAVQARIKSQTRRVMKPRLKWATAAHIAEVIGPTADGLWRLDLRHGDDVITDLIRCPYGKPGDVLWVRETYAVRSDIDPAKALDRARHYCIYKADRRSDPADEMNWHDYGGRWRSSRFMPKWACRLRVPVVSIRPERLWDITEEDAIAEGVYALSDEMMQDATRRVAAEGRVTVTPRDYYAWWWDCLNAARGHPWANNELVWRIEFGRAI